MKVIVKHRSPEEVDKHDYRNAMQININGERVFRVADGEPEDSNLSRDFNDCYGIPNLLKKAYEAGINKEEFELIDIDSDEI